MPSTRSLTTMFIPLCAALLLLAGSALARRGGGHSGEPVVQPSEDQKAVHSLKRQIAAQELALALQLNAEQAAAITTIIGEVQGQRQSRQAERRATASQVRALMQDYLDELRSNGAPSAGTVTDLLALHQQAGPERKSGGEMQQDIRNRLRELLSEEQQLSLRSFRPMAGVRPEHQRKDKRRHRVEMDDSGSGRFAEQGEVRRERRQKRTQRQKIKRTVKDILLSSEMLEVLAR